MALSTIVFFAALSIGQSSNQADQPDTCGAQDETCLIQTKVDVQKHQKADTVQGNMQSGSGYEAVEDRNGICSEDNYPEALDAFTALIEGDALSSASFEFLSEIVCGPIGPTAAMDWEKACDCKKDIDKLDAAERANLAPFLQCDVKTVLNLFAWWSGALPKWQKNVFPEASLLQSKVLDKVGESTEAFNRAASATTLPPTTSRQMESVDYVERLCKADYLSDPNQIDTTLTTSYAPPGSFAQDAPGLVQRQQRLKKGLKDRSSLLGHLSKDSVDSVANTSGVVSVESICQCCDWYEVGAPITAQQLSDCCVKFDKASDCTLADLGADGTSMLQSGEKNTRDQHGTNFDGTVRRKSGRCR